jgi:hypothetical protein
MWTDSADLKAFETATRQRGEQAMDGELWRALAAAYTTSLSDLRLSGDGRPSEAAAEGRRSGLLVPVRDGLQPLALIELLSREPVDPSDDLTASIEAYVPAGPFRASAAARGDAAVAARKADAVTAVRSPGGLCSMRGGRT